MSNFQKFFEENLTMKDLADAILITMAKSMSKMLQMHFDENPEEAQAFLKKVEGKTKEETIEILSEEIIQKYGQLP